MKGVERFAKLSLDNIIALIELFTGILSQMFPNELPSKNWHLGRQSASDYVNMENVFIDKVKTYECEEDYHIWLQKPQRHK